jgi:hypothetical protein
MAISRRRFLKAGTLVALSAAVPLKAAAEVLDHPPSLSGLAGPTLNTVDAVSNLDMQAFSRHLRTDFLLSHARAGRAKVKLIEVHDWRSNATTKTGRECFSLIFRGSESAGLRQNTYAVEHDALGKFEMLLVPIGNKQGHYEAVFNRLH